MLKNRIIPCLDVKNGRVVKGINFVNLKDAGDPVEQASIYDKGGADEICFLDITASNENRNTIIDVVNKTAEKCFVPLTVGGGISSIKKPGFILAKFYTILGVTLDVILFPLRSLGMAFPRLDAPGEIKSVLTALNCLKDTVTPKIALACFKEFLDTPYPLKRIVTLHRLTKNSLPVNISIHTKPAAKSNPGR